MKLVLLKDIKHLGKVGDEVNVKGGFARNFLLPTKSALTPSDENIEIISKMKDELIFHLTYDFNILIRRS